jgi:hypothetical protein
LSEIVCVDEEKGSKNDSPMVKSIEYNPQTIDDAGLAKYFGVHVNMS